MGSRFTEEMKLWLFDLTHGNLDTQQVLQGLFRHYLMYGVSKENVIQDIIFHTNYGDAGVDTALETLNTLYSGIADGTLILEEKKSLV